MFQELEPNLNFGWIEVNADSQEMLLQHVPAFTKTLLPFAVLFTVKWQRTTGAC